MSPELVQRLHDANPVPANEPVLQDEALLARIVATPRHGSDRSSGRAGRRRILVVLAGALILIGGLTAAAFTVAPRYFGSDDEEPTPAAVLAEIRRLANEDQPGVDLRDIDPAGLVRLAAFETGGGLATVWAAPLREGSGFCDVSTIGSELDGWACTAKRVSTAVPWMGSGSSAWGDIRVILGQLEPPAVSVTVRFEDGTIREASTRGPWWVHVMSGDETEPGHRPVELTALAQDGSIVANQPIDLSH
ncbi:MAG TPA: hypothetical protein VFW80_04405 [Gaiellaceae bacterium]|nr:hypothetical protein [Gaiellaceae bacterium]